MLPWGHVVRSIHALSWTKRSDRTVSIWCNNILMQKLLQKVRWSTWNLANINSQRSTGNLKLTNTHWRKLTDNLKFASYQLININWSTRNSQLTGINWQLATHRYQLATDKYQLVTDKDLLATDKYQLTTCNWNVSESPRSVLLIKICGYITYSWRKQWNFSVFQKYRNTSQVIPESWNYHTKSTIKYRI